MRHSYALPVSGTPMILLTSQKLHRILCSKRITSLTGDDWTCLASLCRRSHACTMYSLGRFHDFSQMSERV